MKGNENLRSVSSNDLKSRPSLSLSIRKSDWPRETFLTRTRPCRASSSRGSGRKDSGYDGPSKGPLHSPRRLKFCSLDQMTTSLS